MIIEEFFSRRLIWFHGSVRRQSPRQKLEHLAPTNSLSQYTLQPDQLSHKPWKKTKKRKKTNFSIGLRGRQQEYRITPSTQFHDRTVRPRRGLDGTRCTGTDRQSNQGHGALRKRPLFSPLLLSPLPSPLPLFLL